MPLDPTLDELAGQQQQQPQLPPQMPWSQTPIGQPMTGFGQAAGRGVAGAVKGFNETIGQMATGSPEEQGRASGQFILDALGTMPFGGVEKGALTGTTLYANQWANPWKPWEIQFLKKIYSSDIDPYTFAGLVQKYLPGRPASSIRVKAFQLGLKRPEIPPYVRQPGSPSIANDPKRVAQVEKMMKKNMTFDQMAAEMGDVSARTLRRYVNENLKQRTLKKTSPTSAQPSMPQFNFPESEMPMGDPEYERALEMFLRGAQSQIPDPSLEELFRSLT